MRHLLANFPIPEPYVAALVAGVILQAFVSWRVFASHWVGHATGWPLLTAGLLLAFWAARAAGGVSLAKPTTMVKSGPYAFTRNPMYVAWTLMQPGLALVLNTMWPVVFLPVALVATHYAVVAREERYLERTFGAEYLRYRAKVRRWL